MKKTGFTLVEIVVVTAAVGLIMVAMTSVILSTFRSQNRTKATTIVSQNGAWILGELRRNVLNGKVTACNGDSSVTLTNVTDKEVTTLKCQNNQIASDSAQPTHRATLSGSEVTVKSCVGFIACDVTASNISAVNFAFNLSTNVAGVGVSQDFSLKVTVRN
jgi:prepilin-type N-terminal cleavage/methylation domain-containing protein